MKRCIIVCCIVVLLLGLCSCMGTEVQTTEPVTTQPPTTEPPTTEPPTTEPPPTEPPLPYKLSGSFARVYVDHGGTVWAMAFTAVENTGSENLFLDYGVMTLTADDGRVLGTITSVSAYPQILPPGRTAYYCDVLALDIKKSEHVNVEFSATITETQKEAVRYEITNVELTESDFGGMILSGTVTNTTEQTGEFVCIGAQLFDQDKTPAGFICGYLDGPLEPGDSVDFSFTSFMLPSYLTREDIGKVKVYGYNLEDAP